jgi:uncharacterized membrane protein
MIHFLQLLFGTIILRPYVFIFFAIYLFLAVTNLGWRRAGLFTLVAYLTAFICEWSSAVAATGFPFGLYYYIDQTSHRELWIAGVPFMDSLSFTFLSYVSLELATILLCRLRVRGFEFRMENADRVRRSWLAALLASFLMMYLDIIIDPVALRGDRWFLGKIYYYPNGGAYFGVTITNFLGWFFVCFVIIRLFVMLDRRLFKAGDQVHSGVFDYRVKPLGSIGLYFGVMGFNIFMTFWIGETLIGIAGVIIMLPLLIMTLLTLRIDKLCM